MNYLSLKETILKGGEYKTTGEMDMVIATGLYFQGVSLHSYSDFISIQERLAARLTSFETAKQRAIVIQQALANI